MARHHVGRRQPSPQRGRTQRETGQTRATRRESVYVKGPNRRVHGDRKRASGRLERGRGRGFSPGRWESFRVRQGRPLPNSGHTKSDSAACSEAANAASVLSGGAADQPPPSEKGSPQEAFRPRGGPRGRTARCPGQPAPAASASRATPPPAQPSPGPTPVSHSEHLTRGQMRRAAEGAAGAAEPDRWQ